MKDIFKEILILHASNATQSKDKATKIFKINSDICSKYFKANFNNSFERRTFSKKLKYIGVKAVFQKDSRNEKKNYRRISILPPFNISEIYERCLSK